ncbi:flagellar basal body rod protein FlgC [Lutispora thermophila]|uniref:Flagellar basal body rod protein FlgB n=1 Tax=Lutispora thermophila DSM 19022 TaxID=1122184 RepID=A0A1M6G6E3_9FIRM|nr:flagellar basal body rod protein FlgC [Lutispora thermophila]SHJ05509.1 flagellar basal-body rod protein FlgC [Lutispora thermophila DSM 19022]
MALFDSINISASGLTAERLRMDIISQNIANANTTRTSDGMPYRRKMVVFKEASVNQPFSYYLSNAQNSIKKSGVKVSQIVEDKSEFKLVYNPGHPDADENGYVKMPNVDIMVEMVNMISATRAYEANVTSINSTKSMIMKALEIGRI